MNTQISKTMVWAQAQVYNFLEELLMEDVVFQEQVDAYGDALLDAEIAYQEQEEVFANAMVFA